MLQPTDDSRFAKDSRSTAILNIDRLGYEQFKREREQYFEMQRLAQEVQQVKTDMSEIKQLLQLLVNGKQ